MATPSLTPLADGTSDKHPLLMDRLANANGQFENHGREEHAIDIYRGGDMSPVSNVHDYDDPRDLGNGNLPSTSTQTRNMHSASSSSATNSRNNAFTRRGDANNGQHRSPLSSGLWISIELLVNMSQIIAAVVVLSLSRDEKPQTPLLEWIIGYAAGCFATLPHLYWRYIHRNVQGNHQEVVQGQSGTSNIGPETMYSSATVTQAPSSENHLALAADPQTSERASTSSSRLYSLVDHFKMGLDCFFAVWFVVGNVWIFGGHSSASSAPNLYRLCIVFLTFSCIGYAMPFILCATICCCLPCIISILGLREDLGQNRGATAEVINSLPVYKFKVERTSNLETESSSSGAGEGGVLASGTDKERIILGEDASCCICLAKYANNDDLRVLPCSHFFHKECVDKWLEINALCPLCKYELGEREARR